jgi:hypothetical protein
MKAKQNQTQSKEVASAEPQLKVFSGTLFQKLTGSTLYVGDAPSSSQCASDPPVLRWTGPKVPYSLYCQWCSFMRWSQRTFKSEATLRGVFKEQTGEFDTIVLPQTAQGLHCRELDNHPQRHKAEAPLRNGFEQFMTMHHHCDAAAFQSGTDANDEATQAGLHITLGKILEPAIEIHARLLFRGFKYPSLSLEDWFDIPVAMPDEFPGELRKTIFEYYMIHPPEEKFPEEWKSRIAPEYQATAGLSLERQLNPLFAHAANRDPGIVPPQLQTPRRDDIIIEDADNEYDEARRHVLSWCEFLTPYELGRLLLELFRSEIPVALNEAGVPETIDILTEAFPDTIFTLSSALNKRLGQSCEQSTDPHQPF